MTRILTFLRAMHESEVRVIESAYVNVSESSAIGDTRDLECQITSVMMSVCFVFIMITNFSNSIRKLERTQTYTEFGLCTKSFFWTRH